jgi:hypothetical protein
MDGTKRGAQAPDRDRSSVPGSTSRESLPSRTQNDVLRARWWIRLRGVDVRATTRRCGSREREFKMQFEQNQLAPYIAAVVRTEVR